MNAENAPSLAMQFGGTALALALVLALAWFALRALKKLQNSGLGGSGAPPMEVLRSVGLGPRERLVAVRFREREYLLGVTAGAVTVIDRWPAATGAMGATGAETPPV